jgi:hypothetical protein
MKLPALVLATRDAYVLRFPVPQIPPATPETIDAALRTWAIRLGQQVRFATHDPQWGMKRADPGRPIGKDTLAHYDGTTLLIWDLLLGASSGRGTLNPDPDSQTVNDQTFVPVEPLDSLGGVVPGPVPIPTPASTHTLSDYFAFRDVIVQIYREELRRDVIADPDALVNWLFHWRDEGHDEAWIRARIRESAEWKAQH